MLEAFDVIGEIFLAFRVAFCVWESRHDNACHSSGGLFIKSFHIFLGSFVAAATAAMPAIVAAADHPFMVQSALNAQAPFSIALPTRTEDGKAATTAVIKFVSVECDAAPGKQSVGTAQFRAFFNGAAGFFRLPFSPPQFFDNLTSFTIAQPTLIYADTTIPLDFGLSAGSPPCSVVITGNLLTKDK